MESIDAFLKTTYARLGVSGNCVVAAIALAIIYFCQEKVALSMGRVPAFLENNKGYVIVYVIVVLIAAAYNVRRKPFLTPEMKHSKCHFCGAEMASSELECVRENQDKAFHWIFMCCDHISFCSNYIAFNITHQAIPVILCKRTLRVTNKFCKTLVDPMLLMKY